MNGRPLLSLSAFFLISCSVPQMRVHPELADGAAPLPVRGRDGWQVRQRIEFGEYAVGPVQRSWTRGYDIPMVVRFSGAREQIGFPARDAGGLTAESFCLGRLAERDLPVLNDAFEVNLSTRDHFACTLVIGADRVYDFHVADLNQSTWTQPAAGQLRGAGLEATIRPVSTLDSGQRSLGTSALGFEFVSGGRVLGAVETVNAGRVWIAPDLPPDQRLAIAASAAALLLRSDLADHND